mmetsp:Transcript_45436/g.108066  ORF Transcript_45436/g.108066 Transcript_45436/m.108066 type:complete len:233 (-) Transcript_45436:58-756(-)
MREAIAAIKLPAGAGHWEAHVLASTALLLWASRVESWKLSFTPGALSPSLKVVSLQKSLISMVPSARFWPSDSFHLKMNLTLKLRSNKCRCFPRTTGFDASPPTSHTSCTEKAPPTASMSGMSANFALRLLLADSVTSLSSQVPAAFQADPADLFLGIAGTAASSSEIFVGRNSCFGSAVGFHSRCLYHVRFSSVSTTFSSSFFLASAAGLGLFGSSDSFGLFVSGFLQMRL